MLSISTSRWIENKHFCIRSDLLSCVICVDAGDREHSYIVWQIYEIYIIYFESKTKSKRKTLKFSNIWGKEIYTEN